MSVWSLFHYYYSDQIIFEQEEKCAAPEFLTVPSCYESNM